MVLQHPADARLRGRLVMDHSYPKDVLMVWMGEIKRRSCEKMMNKKKGMRKRSVQKGKKEKNLPK